MDLAETLCVCVCVCVCCTPRTLDLRTSKQPSNYFKVTVWTSRISLKNKVRCPLPQGGNVNYEGLKAPGMNFSPKKGDISWNWSWDQKREATQQEWISAQSFRKKMSGEKIEKEIK